MIKKFIIATFVTVVICSVVGYGVNTLVDKLVASVSNPVILHEKWGTVLKSNLKKPIKGDPKLVISPNFDVDGTAVLATTQGVFATTDGGSNWESIGFSGQDITAIAISPNFKDNVSGAIYVATSKATTPNGVVGTGFYGNASVWFIQNVTGAVWIPTRVYEAVGGINMLAVNASEELYMGVPSLGLPGYWLRWKLSSDGTPTVDMESPGLWVSSDAGTSWSQALPDVSGCSLVFDPYGNGYFFDSDGTIWQTFNGGSTWSLTQYPFGCGPLTDTTFASWAQSGSSHNGSYLMGVASPLCGSTLQSNTLIYQSQTLTSIYDQSITDVSGDFGFAIPGHSRGIVFVSTDKGVYLGGEDSNGDFWDLLRGSPNNVEAIASGKSSGGNPVVFAFDGVSVWRLDLNWPDYNLPELAIKAKQFTSPVIQNQTSVSQVSIKSLNAFKGKVQLVDGDDLTSLFNVKNQGISLTADQGLDVNFNLEAQNNTPPGNYLVFPCVLASDDSAYAGSLRSGVQVIPPPDYLTMSPLNPRSFNIRSGNSDAFQFTISRTSQWNTSYSQVSFSTLDDSNGISFSFSPTTVNLGINSSATVNATVTVAQYVNAGQFSIEIVATSNKFSTDGTLYLSVGAPIPTKFEFVPQKPNDVYRFEPQVTTVEAVDKNGTVLTNYSGNLATLSDTLDSIDSMGKLTLMFNKGVAKIGFFVSRPGQDTLYAKDNSGFSLSSSLPFNVESPPSRFEISPIPNEYVNQSFIVEIKAVDSAGNVVTLYNGTPWILDSSGFLYQKTTPFSNGVWTGNLTIPVVKLNDSLQVGDNNGVTVGMITSPPIYGLSNEFNVTLITGPTGPGSWPEVGYSPGSTNDNPTSLISAGGFKNAKIKFTLPYRLPRACAPPVSQYVVPQCMSLRTLSGGYLTMRTEGSIVVNNGVLVPYLPQGFAAESGQLLWNDKYDYSSPLTFDQNKIFSCYESLDQNWWPNPFGSEPAIGPEAFSSVGTPLWGPLANSQGCSNFKAGSQSLLTINDRGSNVVSTQISSASKYPTFPFKIESISPTNGLVNWSLNLPTDFAERLWDPVQGGGYQEDPVLRIAQNRIGSIAVTANCSLPQNGLCDFGDYNSLNLNAVPLKIFAAQHGSWLWKKTLVQFPYTPNISSDVIYKGLATFSNETEISSFVESVTGGKYSTLAELKSHLYIDGLDDMIASGNVVYLAVELATSDPTKTSSPNVVADAVLALNASTGNPIYETFVWGITGLQLVDTPYGLVAVNRTYSNQGYEIQRTSPGPQIKFGQLGISMFLLGPTGKEIYLKTSLPTQAQYSNPPHATAGGDLVFIDGLYSVNLIDGDFVGYLPDSKGCFYQSTRGSTSSPTQSQQNIANAAGVNPGKTSSVSVAGNWIYYLACGTEKVTAVEIPVVNPALLIAQQYYQLALEYESTRSHSASDNLSVSIGSTSELYSASQDAHIAASMFDAASDPTMAEAASKLAVKLGYTAPPKSLKVIPARVSLSTMLKASKFDGQFSSGTDYGLIAGSVFGLILLIVLRMLLFKKFKI